MHYTFTGGPIGDRLIVKHEGTAEAFTQAAAERAPETTVRILTPGKPLIVESMQRV